MTKKTSLWQRLKEAFTNASNTTVSEGTPSQQPPTQTTAQKDMAQNPFAQDLTGQVIIDLTQLSDNFSQNAFDTPTNQPLENQGITADDLDVMLASMGYHFTYHPPKLPKRFLPNHSPREYTPSENPANDRPIHHFSMQVSDGEREWGCLLRFFEKEQMFAVYSIFPFNVPESHRSELLAVLTYMNYDLVLGNLELDVQDGELRFKTSLDLEVTGLTEYILAYLLQSNFSATAQFFDTLAEAVQNPHPATSPNAAVEFLLTSQKAKTFYLLSEKIQ